MAIAPQVALADALAPLQLPADLCLSPEQFAAVCAANPEAVLELDAAGHLIHMTPTGGETGARSSRLLMRLLAWADQIGGWQLFDSSTGFRLPDGSVLSPDASLLRLERWQALTPEQRRSFPPFVRMWWWNSPAPVIKVPALLPPCARRWRLTRPMGPSWAGC